MRRLLAVGVLVAATLVAAPAQASTTYDVEARNYEFRDAIVRIQPGDTVRWTAVDPDHTITADDGRFHGHLRNRLDQFSWTAGETAEEIRYRCTLHGGMEGVIVVGDPPKAPVPPLPTLVVPDDVPTIAAAATGAQPGTVVLVRPGVYPEAVEVTVPDLQIRGLGESPDAVLLDGGHGRTVGVTVTAPGVHLANLTVAHYRHTGVRVHGAGGAVLEQVVVEDNDLYGIDVRAASGVTMRSLQARRHTVAGVAVRDCPACGVRIEQAVLERNAAGLLTDNATGVLLRGSTVQGNAVGVVLADSAAVTVTDNTLADNDATDVATASVFTHLPLWTGAGIWVSGGRSHHVHRNTVSGHTYNIAVTGPTPVFDTRVAHNTVDGGVHADLGVDTIGTGICLAGNQRPGGEQPTSDPPAAQELYGCDLPATAGVPWPLVTANLARHATG